MTAIDFIHGLHWTDLPVDVQQRAKICVLDLLGVAAAALRLDMSRIARDHAALDLPGTCPILFDDRTAAPMAAAMAGAFTIDALDGHDGYNPAKGHIGCPLLPPLLVFGHLADVSGADFLSALVMGYEFGARASEAQHATVPDYHTSGSWGAVTAAAAGARIMGLDRQQTRHALGIAEYHGPRSQMMRCIDDPTMLKDGSGWGAMSAVSAVQMAQRGFTGAPAITVEKAAGHWTGLGRDWRILRQYFKPYPVCRWAQGPIEAILQLKQLHDITSKDVTQIRIETFAESCALAVSEPKTPEEAQYSTSFPSAVALVRGTVAPEDLDGPALENAEVLRLSRATTMHRSEKADSVFPSQRFARVTLALQNGQSVTSDWVEPRWGPYTQPSDTELRAKFHGLADPVLGAPRAQVLEQVIDTLDQRPLSDLKDLLRAP